LRRGLQVAYHPAGESTDPGHSRRRVRGRDRRRSIRVASAAAAALHARDRPWRSAGRMRRRRGRRAHRRPNRQLALL